MESKLKHISIVVVASNHNPTILNPDFLRHEKIVLDKEWGWELSASPITTPPYSSVEYDSGIKITVEPRKLQIADEKSQNPNDSKIIDIAKKYIEVLPHVHCDAIGFNFHTLIAMEDADKSIKNHFLLDKFLSDEKLITIGMKFVYQASNNGKLVMDLDPAIEEQDDEEPKSVIVARSNFNRACEKGSCGADVVSNFPDISNDWSQHSDTIQKLLG